MNGTGGCSPVGASYGGSFRYSSAAHTPLATSLPYGHPPHRRGRTLTTAPPPASLHEGVMRLLQAVAEGLQVVQRLLLGQFAGDVHARRGLLARGHDQPLGLLLGVHAEDGQVAWRKASTEAHHHGSIELDGSLQ